MCGEEIVKVAKTSNSSGIAKKTIAFVTYPQGYPRLSLITYQDKRISEVSASCRDERGAAVAGTYFCT